MRGHRFTGKCPLRVLTGVRTKGANVRENMLSFINFLSGQTKLSVISGVSLDQWLLEIVYVCMLPT